jgi:hypothetical protein
MSGQPYLHVNAATDLYDDDQVGIQPTKMPPWAGQIAGQKGYNRRTIKKDKRPTKDSESVISCQELR